MRRLKKSLIISCVFWLASTTAFLLEAQESRDLTDVSARVDDGNFEFVSVAEGLKSVKKEKHAFLVGASDYPDPTRSLQFPTKDVEDLKTRLIKIGFREENILVLRSDDEYGLQPTKEYVEEGYRLILSHVQEGDLVFVYLSGQGLQIDGTSYFLPIDFDSKDIPNTSISIDEMAKLLAESRAEFRWMLVDACFAGSNNRKASGVKEATSGENDSSSVSLLQCCQPGALAYEGGRSKDSNVHNGIFTLALLEALDDDGKGDLNGDGVVSFLEICQYVTKRTNVLANYHHNHEQVPCLSGNIADFAFWDGLTEAEAKKAYENGQAYLSLAFEKFNRAYEKEPENEEYARMFDVMQKLADDEKKWREEVKNAKKNAATDDSESVGKPSDPTPSEEPTTSSDDASDWTGNCEAGTRKTFTINGVEFAFCYCPAGTFAMGSPSTEEGRYDNETQHEVRLTKGFWMLETEVTQEQWDALGLKKNKECRFKGKNLPVENVSWEECVAFIAKLNESAQTPKGLKFSLPTEAQWEYACRAGTTTAYSWGDSLNGDKANCNGNYPYDTTIKGKKLKETSPVKSYEPNPWGLYDMHGNVWEWCSDRYDDYPSVSAVDPFGVTNALDRVFRGGCYFHSASDSRAACRNYTAPKNRFDFLGFRMIAK